MKTKEEIDEIFDDALQRYGFETAIDPEGWREFIDSKGDQEVPWHVATMALDHSFHLIPSGGYRAIYAWADYIMEMWK